MNGCFDAVTRNRRCGRTLPLAALALAFAFLLPATARAGADLYLDVDNQTRYPLRVIDIQDNCWYPNDLAAANAPRIEPGKSVQLHSEEKASGGCWNQSSFMRIELGFEGAGPGFQNPIAAADAAPTAPDWGDAWQLFYNNGVWFKMYATPRGWLPVNASQSGTSTAAGAGLFCLDLRQLDLTEIRMTVRDVATQGCTAPPGAPTTRPRASDLRAAPAGPSKRAAATPAVVYDVFQLGRGACSLLDLSQPWGASPCSTIDDDGAWDLHNVTNDVRSVKAESEPHLAKARRQLENSPFSQHNTTGTTGNLEYSFSWTHGTDTSTSTESGYSFGHSVSIESGIKIPIIDGTASYTFSADQNWSSSKSTTTSTSTTGAISSSIPTQPHGTTWMYAFQDVGDVAFTYSADLTSGVASSAQPIRTPMTRPLGMSAARKHPCIGYLGGDGDPGSLMGLGKLATAKGYSPQTVGLTEMQRAFLTGVTGFKVSKDDRCPGFPAGYPGSMSFKGTAVAVGHAGGPLAGGDASWAPRDLGGIQTCAWYKWDGTPPKPDDPGPDVNPCVPAGTEPSAAGTVVDAADAPRAERTEGDEGSNLLRADADPDTDSLIAGPGPFDVLQGSEHGEKMYGGPGEDVAFGEGGPDRIDGGSGDDTLDAGPGDDDLIDRVGDNSLLAGPGDDRLESSATAEGGLVGAEGDDELIMHGEGPVALLGGPGDDIHRLLGGAAPRSITELPREGSDTIVTRRSVTLPPYVERARATGAKGVSLRGSSAAADETLVGAGGDDTLAGGVGSDAVSGHGGDDQILLAAFGFDRARGGKGADRFRVMHEPPPDPSFAIGTVPGRAASAHLIEDLDPREGDRLILPVRRFGKRLAELRHRLRVTRGAEARGKGPQLLFSPKLELLSYDRDGRGGAAADTIAILEGHDRVPRRAIVIDTDR